jgi:hypothetical protein
MRKAFFVKDVINIDQYLPRMNGEVLVCYSDYYNINTKHPKIEWSKYKAEYINHKEPNIIIVGLNRIRTPDSRYDLVYSYLYKMNDFETKITIDEKPFNSEPWRCWYHYGFLFKTWLGVDYSNVLESDWSHWFYRDRNDCLISSKNLKNHIKNTYSDLDFLITEFEFYEPDLFLNEYYQEIKTIAFEKYGTPKQIIQFMIKHLNSKIKIDFGFESYLTNKKYLLPNFGVFCFLVEENKRRMDIYNTLISSNV